MGEILVENLGKAYKQYPTRWARLIEWIDPCHRPRHSVKWVLRELNFRIRSGEAVGIIGMNGAGKSTLLKMITGTTRPTSGSVHMSGNVAALLELGMGFHPDFSGRQNAYMAAQLLGYSDEEISQLMPDIEKFAEIGEYIDLPVRVYSSGMQMRLAFSVATAKRPDVLIVDEALSVGDAYFQHKSFERIRDFRKKGTTLLIVSHDKQAIQSICDRAILLKNGTIEMEGKPEAVMDYYNALLAENQNQKVRQEEVADGKLQTISGTGEASVRSVELLDENGLLLDVANVGQYVNLRIKVISNNDIKTLVLGYGIKDRLGQVVYGTNTYYTEQQIENIHKDDCYEFNMRFNLNLGPGTYSIQTALVSDDSHLNNNYEWRDLALVFNVVNLDKQKFVGMAWMPPKIDIAKL